MTSLAETYERRAGEAGRRRVFLGTGLFLAGALLLVAGVLAGATTLLIGAGLAPWEAREVAGVLAGLGLPAVFVGIFTVLPAGRSQRAAAAIGAALAVVGVILFRAVYPENWYSTGGTPTTATLSVVGLYFVGTITTFWCLFTAVATFKTRADPGGTVSLTFQQGGERRTVEVAADDAAAAREALGGIGVFGDVVDHSDDAPETRTGGATTSSPGATSDGGQAGATTLDSPSDDAEVLDDDAAPGPVDQYCGNCAHFDYVRTDDGIQRYCGFHDEVMDDMDPCESWAPN